MEATRCKRYWPSRRKRRGTGRALQLALPGMWLIPIGCGCMRGAG